MDAVQKPARDIIVLLQRREGPAAEGVGGMCTDRCTACAAGSLPKAAAQPILRWNSQVEFMQRERHKSAMLADYCAADCEQAAVE